MKFFNNKKTAKTDNVNSFEEDDKFSDVELSKKGKSSYGNELLPAASRSFLEIYGIHIDQSKKWKSVAFASLAITAFAVVWAAKVSTGIKYIPVLIQQNDIGNLTPLGVLNSNKLNVSEQVVVAQIGTYITDMRSVIQDVKLEQQRGQQISLMTSDADRDKMQGMFISQLKEAGRDTITINIVQIMPMRVAKNNTWKATWIEYYGTTPTESRRYEAIFNVSLKNLTTNNPDEIMLNPTGFQVGNFSMSEVFNNKITPDSSNN